MTDTQSPPRSSFLTMATSEGRQSRDDFNAVVAAGRLQGDAEDLLPSLIETFRKCGDPALWNVVEEGEADLPTTLGLIRMEIIESIGKAGMTSNDALSLLSEALDEDDDTLHFSAFKAVRDLGPAATSLVENIEHYVRELDVRNLPVESLPHLRVEALKALDSIK